MNRMIEVTAHVSLPDKPIEDVHLTAQNLADTMLAVEEASGLKFNPRPMVNEEHHTAMVYFTCDQNLLTLVALKLCLPVEAPGEASA